MPGLEGTALGHYQLLRLLGKGGMAEVYLAHDEEMDREVAVKVVGGNNADYLERFWREVEAIDKLSHHHILPAFDYDDEGPWHYLVMLYTPGGTLRDLLEQGPLTPQEAGELLDQIASALQFAHDHGIIHRDIKPSNILLRDRHYAYLADFGLAKTLDGSSELTQTGALLGTPEYMAPDLAEGPATTSSDIYALGIVLYQMVTGHLPFTAETPVAVYWKQLRDDPLPPSLLNSTLSPAIDDVIMRALEKDPRKRFQTVQELADAYRQAVQLQAHPSGQHGPAHAPPMRSHSIEQRMFTPPEPVQRPPRGRRAAMLRRRAILPGPPQVVPTAVAVPPQETRTPPEMVLPDLPMRTSPSNPTIQQDEVYTPLPPERIHLHSRRQRTIFLSVLIIGLILFIGLPMGYAYYAFSTHPQPVSTSTPTPLPTGQPASTPQPAQASTTIPDPALSGTPLLVDSLTNSMDNRWTEDQYCAFSGKSYHVYVKQANALESCPLLSSSMDNDALQVDVTLLSGSSAGMLLRASAEQYYDFEINSQGQFFFRRHDGGNGMLYDMLIAPTTSSAIKPLGQPNTLLAIARGNDFKLYINGTFVGEVHDSTYASGQFALAASTLAQASGEGVFNNFKMYRA